MILEDGYELQNVKYGDDRETGSAAHNYSVKYDGDGRALTLTLYDVRYSETVQARVEKVMWSSGIMPMGAADVKAGIWRMKDMGRMAAGMKSRLLLCVPICGRIRRLVQIYLRGPAIR